MCRLVALSSTISTGKPRSTAGGEAAVVSGGCGWSPKRAVKAKVLPRPGTLSTVICPPIRATSRAAMVRPRPVPPYLRVVEVSSCSKAWKIFACFSGGMPMPVSVTANRILASWRDPVYAVRGRHQGCRRPLVIPRSTTTSPAFGELDGVAHEVEEHLAEPAGVADQGIGHVGPPLADQFQPLLVRAHGQSAQGVAQHGSRSEKSAGSSSRLAGLDLGEVEDVVDDPEEGIRRRLDRRQVLPLVLGEGGVEGQLGHAEDGVHGRADLVADVGQELVLGPVGRLRRLLGLLEGFGRPLLVVDVGVGPEPHQHPAFGIAHGQGAAEVPAVNAVRTAEAVLQLKRLTGGDGVLPAPDVLLHVFGVDELQPPPAFNLVEGKPGELRPWLVEIIHVPVGVWR